MLNVTETFYKLKPFILGLISTAGGGEGPFAPSPHDLNGVHHTGTLATSQYPDALLRDGSRTMTGNLDMGGNDVTNVGDVDGVDISAHVASATAHQDLVSLDANADTVLSLSTQALGLDNQSANTVWAGPTSGGAAVPAFRSLVFGDLPTLAGTPALTFSTVNGAGVANSFIRTDATIALFDTASPVTITPDASGSAGSAGVAARRDHVHAIACAAPGANSVNLSASTEGTGSNFARADHTHQLDVSIAPTWTGVHTFNADIQLNADLDFVGAQSITTTSGNLALSPSGDIVLNPGGNDVLPGTGYTVNFGELANKYLTLHAAELWVETLVAQDTIATIGGRILVGPTTALTSDVATGDGSIAVKHNQMSVDDIVYLEANGKVEFLRIASGPTGTGPYTYGVFRNLDGSGANSWYAGDAVFNTGQIGDGFIDLYSLNGVLSGAGPTIVGNVRNSLVYSDYTEAWAIGNLNGLYGYGADTYGVALGSYSITTYITLDATNGLRFFDASDNERVALTTAGVFEINNSSGSAVFTFNASDGAEFTLPLTIGTNGGIFQGTGTFASPTTGLKIWNDGGVGRIAGYNAGTVQWYANTDGKFYAGGGVSIVDASGFSVVSTTAYADERAYKILDSAGTTVIGTLYGYGVTLPAPTNYINLTAEAIAAKDTILVLQSSAVSSYTAEIAIGAIDGGGGLATIDISSAGYIYLGADTVTIGQYLYHDGDTNTYLRYRDDRVTIAAGGVTMIDAVESTTDYLALLNGLNCIGDTSNANMAVGLTINQGANDDELLGLKSSDVNHGMTTRAETDTFATFKKLSGTSGGMQFQGYTEATQAVIFFGNFTTDSTTKSSSANGALAVYARKKSGTTSGAVNSAQNVFNVQANISGATRNMAIFGADGDLYLDTVVNENAWDEYDDGQLLHGLRASLVPDGHELKRRFGQWIDYARPILKRYGVVHYNDDGHYFVASKKLQMLTVDAVRQLYERVLVLEGKLKMLGVEV